MSTFLHRTFGYRRGDMVILTDDQQNPLSLPTRANILRAMHWLVKDARPDDSLFLHFSGMIPSPWSLQVLANPNGPRTGHGGRTPDLDGDEEDGYDDVIYPLDYRSAGHIVDDDLHAILVRPLRPGVRLTAIFDSCHSGTALDLPYVYSTQGVLKEPNLAKEAAHDLFRAWQSYGSGDLSGVAHTALGFIKKAAGGSSARERTVLTKTSPADVVMFSGSKDTQTSFVFPSPFSPVPRQRTQLNRQSRYLPRRRGSRRPQLGVHHRLGPMAAPELPAAAQLDPHRAGRLLLAETAAEQQPSVGR